jgi:hypothetical protein
MKRTDRQRLVWTIVMTASPEETVEVALVVVASSSAAAQLLLEQEVQAQRVDLVLQE